MRPSFQPRLVNGPFDDPGLFIPFLFSKNAVVFDLGDMHALSSKDKLKISHAFISHTHMDHFIGFDDMLRLMLGRDKVLHLYGPEGFIEKVEGKLAGYSWNLVGNYGNRFLLKVFEILPDHIIGNTYGCRDSFRRSQKPFSRPFSGVLVEDAAFSVSAVILDHDIPCLGFSIAESFHINIKKQAVLDLGLEIGPWLNRFKLAFYRYGPSRDHEFRVPRKGGIYHEKAFTMNELADKIAVITPGQKVTYVADTAYTESNNRKIIELARASDHLFIEASFLDSDRGIAEKKHHLTARQAGTIAGKAGVRQFTIFHFSPRYTGMENLLYAEAAAAFKESGPIL
jgi:ribonuclease Z